MSVLSELSNYIAANIGALDVGTNLFEGNMPSTPIECVVLYEYASSPPMQTMGTDDVVISRPRVQVLCRSSSYPNGRALIGNVHELLRKVRGCTLDSVRYLQIEPLDEPTMNQRDSNHRPIFGFNIEVWKEPS